MCALQNWLLTLRRKILQSGDNIETSGVCVKHLGVEYHEKVVGSCGAVMSNGR